MKNPHVIISRRNPFFNFGQIVDALSYNEFIECLLVKGSGNRYEEIHYSEVYPCDKIYDYEKLNKAMKVINHE